MMQSRELGAAETVAALQLQLGAGAAQHAALTEHLHGQSQAHMRAESHLREEHVRREEAEHHALERAA